MAAERIVIEQATVEALFDPTRRPGSVTVNGAPFQILSAIGATTLGGAGFKGVVLKVSNRLGRPRALKLTIRADYENRPFRQELEYAAQLESSEVFARVEDGGFVELPGIGKFVAFVEEWIEGQTLTHYLAAGAASIEFLRAYVEQICEALGVLHALELMHDDLHAGNVMLTRPPEGSLDDALRLKVVDLGSMKPVVEHTKSRDDHANFAGQIIAIHNAIRRRRRISVAARRYLREVEELVRHSLLENDTLRAVRDPKQLHERFEEAWIRANDVRPEAGQVIRTPFEYISAEQMADDRLLVDLFAETCPWLDDVASADPCLLTGPRGCGKSTVFRWLSIRAHLHRPDLTELAQRGIAGFYISCTTDLQNKLGWIHSDELARRFRREIIHYFNLLLTREVVETLEGICRRSDVDTFWGFGPPQQGKLSAFLRDALARYVQPRLQGVSPMAQLLEAIDRAMVECHADMLQWRQRSETTDESFIGDLTRFLAELLPIFRDWKITFLVDDFSIHRLDLPVQAVLNRIIWQRSPHHIFKVSAEKLGMTRNDEAGAVIDVARELIEIDCGREYLRLDDQDLRERAKRFATDLLDNRLAKVGWTGRAIDLVGPSHWPEGSLARALVNRQSGRSHDEYHGLDCVADLCSGDVSSLLLVYREIFQMGRVNTATNTTVASNVQDAAIRSVSRRLVDNVRASSPEGPAMFKVLNAFGQLVRNHLERITVKKGAGTTPCQIPRIEIDQQAELVADQLSAEARKIYDALIRRAVFIEMSDGLGRHGNVTTLRWHLRRVFLPSFGAALGKNDAVKASVDWLDWFLLRPDNACAPVLTARLQSAESAASQTMELPLETL